MRRETPVGKRLGGFALEAEDERFLEQLAADLRPQLAWLLGDRRNDFHRELSEGHLDVALEMLLEDRRANPRNVSATKAAHAMREAIRDHVRNRVGPMDAVPFLVREPQIAARSYVRVLPLINGVSTVEDIIGSCQLPVLETIRALSRLHKVGCIELPGIDLPALVPRKERTAARAPDSHGAELRGRADDDRAPASSRLTMPEILAPFAADLEAMGVGDAETSQPAVSGEHPVARSHHAEPERASRAKTSIADPTTPIPDGDEPYDAPLSARRRERPHAARGANLDEAVPGARIADEVTAPAERIAEHDSPDDAGAGRAGSRRRTEAGTTEAGTADEETSAPESYGEDAERASQPVVDPALDELGAIWRQRANRKSETPARRDDTTAARAVVAAPAALADDPPPKESARSLPSIPALDPPLAAEPTYGEGAPVSRSHSAPAANVRFIAIVAALAGLVIVAMIALRYVRSAPPSEPSVRVGTGAARTEPATAPAAPPPVAPASPADTAPSFIDRGTVTYTIKVTPKYARVFLDDVLLVPVTEVKLRREDKEHVLRAEAPGFGTREITVSAKSDASLVIALDKAPDARPPAALPKSQSSTAPKTPPKAASSAAPAAPTQPYPD